jgi:D-alanyl-D-alanine carboxypeptidase
MKKALLVLIIGLIMVGAFGYFTSIKPDKPSGVVLGESINNFYLEKKIKIHNYPKKIELVPAVNIQAESVELIDSQTKYPLFEKNPTNSVPIASITKVMTAIIVLDNYKLDEIVQVAKEDTEVNGSKVFLKTGERMTVENLLYSMLMPSGNDAAITLATYKQSKEKFVELMNKKAQDLGLKDTKFMDPAGLNDQGRSTARDIAILFSYALNNAEFIKIISTAEKTVSSVDGSETHDLKNSNRLTTGEIPMDGVIGGKTGFTPDAGHTLVAGAKRNNNIIVGVVLNTYSNANSASAEEMRKLLSYGFDAYTFTN